MSVHVDFRRETTWLWRCNRCSVEGTPMGATSPTPLGWSAYDYEGERCHLCAECRIRSGLDPGFLVFGSEA